MRGEGGEERRRGHSDCNQGADDRIPLYRVLMSCDSNPKKGTLDEFDCALGVSRSKKDAIKDFVISLKIDNLP
jgi:hypothetical protein